MEKTSERVNVVNAARLLGMSPDRLRYALRQGRFRDIGEAVERKNKKTGKTQYSYYVYRRKVLERVGLNEWPGEAS